MVHIQYRVSWLQISSANIIRHRICIEYADTHPVQANHKHDVLYIWYCWFIQLIHYFMRKIMWIFWYIVIRLYWSVLLLSELLTASLTGKSVLKTCMQFSCYILLGIIIMCTRYFCLIYCASLVPKVNLNQVSNVILPREIRFQRTFSICLLITLRLQQNDYLQMIL